MPRLTQARPKYRRHTRGQAVVTLNGSDFYLGPHGSQASRREYDRLVGEWMASGRRLQPTESDLNCVELVARYGQWAHAYYQRDGKSTRVSPGIKFALR